MTGVRLFVEPEFGAAIKQRGVIYWLVGRLSQVDRVAARLGISQWRRQEAGGEMAYRLTFGEYVAAARLGVPLPEA